MTTAKAIDWQSLACRFGCDDPVIGLYFAPDGCWCFPDRIQALCEQHAVKGLQNNDMTLLLERPLDKALKTPIVLRVEHAAGAKSVVVANTVEEAKAAVDFFSRLEDRS
jgi:hypothetical protein